MGKNLLREYGRGLNKEEVDRATGYAQESGTDYSAKAHTAPESDTGIRERLRLKNEYSSYQASQPQEKKRIPVTKVIVTTSGGEELKYRGPGGKLYDYDPND